MSVSWNHFPVSINRVSIHCAFESSTKPFDTGVTEPNQIRQYLVYLNMFVVISVAILFGTLYYVWYRVFSYQGLPKTLSFAGSDGSFLSRGRASFKSVLHLDSLLWAGHVEVSSVPSISTVQS